ncbi:hypothetical protein OG819_52685 [Streptomyces sp. NBC_01549]|uniref:hypothetical protein n=1 Tax=unclassified Streptomyces TaxID=2593676 RepID=UPI00225B6FCD|nr:hypothetical protein [Streptomyces sp. NBC_01549]MCX4597879.1 hypothetical protein [Streptomyces sp. NBC_01549]
MVGASAGGLTVHDDDPRPMVSVTPVADHVTEGQTLTWRLTLSAAADTDLYPTARFLPADTGTELSTTDVDPHWLNDVDIPVDDRADPAGEQLLGKLVDPPMAQPPREVRLSRLGRLDHRELVTGVVTVPASGPGEAEHRVAQAS